MVPECFYPSRRCSANTVPRLLAILLDPSTLTKRPVTSLASWTVPFPPRTATYLETQENAQVGDDTGPTWHATSGGLVFSCVEKDPKVVSLLSGKAVTEVPILGPIWTTAAKDKDHCENNVGWYSYDRVIIPDSLPESLPYSIYSHQYDQSRSF